MLPVESLKFLTDMVKVAAPERAIVKPPAEPPHVYLIAKPDGTFERCEADDQPTRHDAADLETLAAWVKRQDGKFGEVWYSRAAVCGGLAPADDSSDRCTLTLTPSPQLARLMEWEKAGGANLTQEDFVKQLRTTLADCYPDFPQLLPTIRSIAFKKAEEMNAAVQHGKVSLGRSVMASMDAAEKVPEEITFRVPIFASAAVVYFAPVRLAVFIDPKTERFGLVVLAGQIEAAFSLAEDRIAARLRELLGDGIPLYRGEA